MEKQMKYQVQYECRGFEVKSATYLGDNRAGIVVENKSYNSKLLVINADNGLLLWEKEIKEATEGGAIPVFDEKAIYIPLSVSHSSYAITAHEPQTGKELWKATIGNTLTVPLAQSENYIFYVNPDNRKFRILDKKNGKTVCNGKLKNPIRYHTKINAWGDKFAVVGEASKTNKFWLDIYDPAVEGGFVANFADFQPKGEYIEGNHCVVGDFLYFCTHAGVIYKFNLATGKVEAKHVVGKSEDLSRRAFIYSNIIQIDGQIICSVKHNLVDNTSSCVIAKIDLQTGAFSSLPIALEPFVHRILPNGIGINLSKQTEKTGIIIYNALTAETPETISLGGWSENMVFTNLAQYKYGRQWLVVDRNILCMQPLKDSVSDTTGNLICWKI